MSAPGGTVTYRGRSLDEVLPRVRDELGPDAVIERRRTGLVGGVGGFFQREMVEVDARAADAAPAPAPAGGFEAYAGADDDDADLRAATLAPDETEALPWDDEDLGEGLASPAMRQIVAGASPFAELLRAETEHAATHGTAPPVSPETQGTVPSVALSPAAAGHERRLVEHGLPAARARSVVAETVAHALPFTASKHLKRTVRATLARRIPVQHSVGGSGRVLALVGPAGAGRTRTAAGLAAAYARAGGRPVAALALRPADGGAELAALLAPHGVAPAAVDAGAAVRDALAGHADDLVAVVDAPAASPRDPAAVAALAADLAAAGVTETHVVLPATVAAPVARAALAAYAPLHPAALVLTHTDETDHLGGLVDLAIELGLPLSFLVAGADPSDGIALADPLALATRLLP